MDLELRENLDKLHDTIEHFIDWIEEEKQDMLESNEETEYEFLRDESGISNSDLDNFVETLQHVTEFIEKLK